MHHDAFVDSCIFIAYATEFEDFHSKCITFFEDTECEKYTSESVEGELKRKLKRRNALYKDYSKFLASKSNDYSASIYLNENDIRHLQDFREHLASTPVHEQLTFLRLFGKKLEFRIKKAMRFIREIIPRNGDAYFKAIINSVISNENDSWILNDAVHLSLNNNNVVFVTLDGEIYHNREELLRKVIDFKFLTDAPMRIAHLGYDFQE